MEYFRTVAASGRVVENLLVFLSISDSAARHGHIASATTRIVTIDALNRGGEYRIWPIVDMPHRLEGLNNPHLAHVETLQYSGYCTAVRCDVSYVEFLRARETLPRLHHSSGLRIEETWIDFTFRMYLAKIAEVASAISPPEKECVGSNMGGP